MGKHHVAPIDKLNAHVFKSEDDDDGCWLWQLSCAPNGYGKMWIDGRYYSTHRIAYEVFVGPIPEGSDIDHLCHNRDAELGLCSGGWECYHRPCVRPDHLDPKRRRANLLASPLTEASRLIGSSQRV